MYFSKSHISEVTLGFKSTLNYQTLQNFTYAYFQMLRPTQLGINLYPKAVVLTVFIEILCLISSQMSILFLTPENFFLIIIFS